MKDVHERAVQNTKYKRQPQRGQTTKQMCQTNQRALTADTMPRGEERSTRLKCRSNLCLSTQTKRVLTVCNKSQVAQSAGTVAGRASIQISRNGPPLTKIVIYDLSMTTPRCCGSRKLSRNSVGYELYNGVFPKCLDYQKTTENELGSELKC